MKKTRNHSLMATAVAATAISLCINIKAVADSGPEIGQENLRDDGENIFHNKQKLIDYCSDRVESAYESCTDSAIDRMIKSSRLCIYPSLSPTPGQPPKKPDADVVKECFDDARLELEDTRFECSRRKAVELVRCMENPRLR